MKAVYHVLAGALGQETRLAQIAHNLANVNTPGFRQDRSAFVDYFAAAVQQTGAGASAGGALTPANPAAPEAGLEPVWPILGASRVDTTPGPILATQAPLDASIEGEGFFQVAVEGRSEPLLTRAGSFRLRADGTLVTAAGHAVLDDGGRPITLEPAQGEAAIQPDGRITVGGQEAARLGIVQVRDPGALGRYGEGLFIPRRDDPPTPVEAAKVRPGTLEGANVPVIAAMIDMIETERAYQTHQKAIQTLDELTARRIDAARGG